MSSNEDSFYSACSSLNITSATDDYFVDNVGNYLHTKFASTNCLNICHINGQSIPAHYSDLLDTFSSPYLHALLISESWLKPSLSSTLYSLPGFVLIRSDRTGKGGGGVAIYLRSEYAYDVIAISPSEYRGSAEYLFLEVDIKGLRVVLGVVYCPPSTDYFSHIESVIDSISTINKHIIIMGDFNTNLLKDTPQSRKLKAIINSADLYILPSGPTHHNVDTEDSWLDIICTSSADHVIYHDQLAVPAFSRHDLLVMSYKLKPPKPRPVIVYLRNFNKIDTNRLDRDAKKIEWGPLLEANNIDDKIVNLNTQILELFDKHAPVRAVRLRRPPAPWITDEVRRAMVRRDRAFHTFKKNRNSLTFQNYKRARNRCNQVVRTAKRRYFHNSILNSSSADIWKFLNSLGFGKSHSNSLTTNISLNDLNIHFSSASHLNYSTKVTTLQELNSMPLLSSNSFNFSSVTDEDTRKAMLSIKSSATGYDEVSRSMVLLILDIITPVLTHIINFSLSTGVFPKLWLKAFVLPLAKVPNPSLPSHFRPISILPFLSKALESLVHKQVTSFISKCNFLSTYQSGFRPGHSTTTALLQVTEDFREGMEKSCLTVLVLIDFSNAFNCVDHDFLLVLLSRLNFSSSALDWFSSYLRGRQQAVRSGQDFSDWCDLSLGVPQGGILSPLLFSVFINLLTTHLQCSYHLYADDLQLYSQASLAEIDTAIAAINRDLQRISDWSQRFGITVNPNKCQAIVIGSRRLVSQLNISELPSIQYENCIIPFRTSVKDLGLIIDPSLSWTLQVSEVCRKVTGILRSIYRLKFFLPPSTKLLLIQSLILPLFDYADVCLTNISQELLNKLDRILNNCIRFIFGLRKYDHVSEFRSQLKWLTIRQRRDFRILSTLFSVLNDSLAPLYLKDRFQYRSDTHSLDLRSSHNSLLSTPLHRTGFMSNSFTVTSITLWNKLPVDLRIIPAKNVFKRKLYEHIRSLQS